MEPSSNKAIQVRFIQQFSEENFNPKEYVIDKDLNISKATLFKRFTVWLSQLVNGSKSKYDELAVAQKIDDAVEAWLKDRPPVTKEANSLRGRLITHISELEGNYTNPAAKAIFDRRIAEDLLPKYRS